jgi:hypothetical protein
MVFALFRRLTAQPDRRREPREPCIDGRIVLGGRNYPLKDWSPRGFSAVGVAAEHYPGDRVALTVEVDLESEALRFDCSAVVVWVDRERRELAGVFTDLDRDVQERMALALTARSTARQGGGEPQLA